MSKYISQECQKELESQKDYNGDETKYELKSIIIHTGGAYGGHYFAYIKNFADDKWYCYDDQHVTQVDQSDVDKFLEHPDVQAKREADKRCLKQEAEGLRCLSEGEKAC